MKNNNAILLFVLIVPIAIVAYTTWFSKSNKPENIINTNEESASAQSSGEIKEKTMTSATLHTSKGDITIEFFEKDAPKTVANFLKLAKDGFYNGIKFHRVIKGFMIQAGDPLTKDDSKMDHWGEGGPGYTVPAEIKLKNTRGTVATARLGDQVNPEKESSGSQFFINTVDNAFLDNNYTVFGKVVGGMDVVDAISNVKTTEPGVKDRPVDPMVINSVTTQ